MRRSGHIKGMDEKELARRIMECWPEGLRSRGWPILRWINGWVRIWAEFELNDGGWSFSIGCHGGRSG